MAGRLDQGLKAKLAKRLRKRDTVAINKIVYARASRLGISSEAALVQLAKKHGIGTSRYQARLDPGKQAEIRHAARSPIVPLGRNAGKGAPRASARGRADTSTAALREAIRSLLQDDELHDRCADLLTRPRHFDRPINQATQVLEDRIRQRTDPQSRLVGEPLVNFYFKEKLDETLMRVPGGDPDEQRGFTQMLRGIVGAFRNPTHHRISKKFSRQDAMRVCCFVDVLLRVVDGCTKVR